MPSEPADSGDSVRLVHEQFIKHSDLVRGFIRSLLPDQSRADDVMQETFLTVTQKARDFEPGTSFQNWVCTIARYKVLEARRAMGRGALLLSEEVIEALAVTEEATQPDVRLDRLKECREHLPPTMRRAVNLRYDGDHSPPEIARRMDWKVEAVYVALSRARALLRDCVSKQPQQNRC